MGEKTREEYAKRWKERQAWRASLIPFHIKMIGNVLPWIAFVLVIAYVPNHWIAPILSALAWFYVAAAWGSYEETYIDRAERNLNLH